MNLDLAFQEVLSYLEILLGLCSRICLQNQNWPVFLAQEMSAASYCLAIPNTAL